MKKGLSISLILTFVLAIVLSGCGGGSGISKSSSSASASASASVEPSSPAATASSSASASEPAATASASSSGPALAFDPNKFEPALPTDTKGTLTFWAAWPLDSWKKFFNSVYPNVKVNLVTMDSIEGKLKTALAAGSGAPDLVFLDGGLMGNYNTIDGFEDLLQQPYDAGKYKDAFPEAVWQKFFTLDGQKLMSIPTDVAPAVTFYRSDILEENGFPTDPQELSDYIADPENFISMAKTLKAAGKYVIQWDSEPLNIYTFGIGFFDRNLNWQRNTDQFVKGLDLAKRFKQEKLASNIDFWSDQGTQAVASGKTAMTFLGVWGTDEIQNKAPDTKGKWHTTSLPFGASGNWGGASVGITKQSKNKELAWEFIRLNLLNNLYANKENIEYGGTPAFLPTFDLLDKLEKPNEFLGNQMTGHFYQELAKKIPLSISTPLDAKAQKIWDKGIQEALDKNMDSKTALQNIQDQIEKEMSGDISKLKQQLGIQ